MNQIWGALNSLETQVSATISTAEWTGRTQAPRHASALYEKVIDYLRFLGRHRLWAAGTEQQRNASGRHCDKQNTKQLNDYWWTLEQIHGIKLCILIQSEAKRNKPGLNLLPWFMSPHLKGYSAERLTVCSNVEVNLRVLVSGCGAVATQAGDGKRQRAKLYSVW